MSQLNFNSWLVAGFVNIATNSRCEFIHTATLIATQMEK